jgi:hypothetical protein
MRREECGLREPSVRLDSQLAEQHIPLCLVFYSPSDFRSKKTPASFFRKPFSCAGMSQQLNENEGNAAKGICSVNEVQTFERHLVL